jgi:hypothetical protein
MGIAEALNIAVGDVLILNKRPQGNTRHLKADTEVTLAAKNAAAADVLKGTVAGPNFVTDLESELDDLGVDRTGVVFEVSDVKEPQTISPMGGYVVPSYKPGSAVVQFKSYSPMEEDEVWDVNPNTETGKKYLTNIAAISALAMVVAVLAMLEYWVFLCGHNCGCCCAKVCSCCNKKGAWGGAVVARPLLALMLITTLVIMCNSLTASAHFKSGLAEVADVLGETTSLVQTVELAVGKLKNASSVYQSVGASAKVTSPLPPPRGAGLGCDTDATGAALAGAGDAFAAAADMLGGMVNGTAGKILAVRTQLTEDGPGLAKPKLLDDLAIATIALFVPWTLLGLVGVGLGSRHPLLSDGCLNCVAILGLVILWVIAVMLAVELAIGVLFADFCFSDPLVAIVALVRENLEGEPADVVAFYMDCAGGRGNDFNPINANLVTASQTAGVLGDIAEGAAQAGACNADTLSAVYAPGTGASAVVAEAVAEIQGAFSCQKINPLFVNATHVALCGHTMNGIAALFATQLAAVMCMLFTLHYASLTRPYMNANAKTETGPAGLDGDKTATAVGFDSKRQDIVNAKRAAKSVV